MKITLSIDDGCASDVRVAELAKKYNIETVFYWPVEWHSLAYANGYEPLGHKEAQDITDYFEIGSHTITHRHLTKLSIKEAQREINNSRTILMRIFDIDIRKFCPPRGYTNDELTKFTLEHYESQRLTKGQYLVHIHPDSGANNNIDWRIVAQAKKDNNQDFELWGHSWEFDKYNLWDELEGVLKTL